MQFIPAGVRRAVLLTLTGAALGPFWWAGRASPAEPILPPILFPPSVATDPGAASPSARPGIDPPVGLAPIVRGVANDKPSPDQLPPRKFDPALPQQAEQAPSPALVTPKASPVAGNRVQTLPIDLAYALRLANESNPTIALAREKIREADARRQQAAVLWVPNAWLGGNPESPSFLPTFFHHDGVLQNSGGHILDVSKSNMFLGTGATLDFSLADALFAPRIARQAENAAAARARAVDYDVQLEVAYAYLDLLRIFGALAINAETLAKSEEMLTFADEAFKAGLGKTTADVNRARAEVAALRQERIELEGDGGVASARLAQLLLLDPTVDLVPADRAVEPIALVSTDGPLDELIAVGLMNRPELAESRALVQAALIEWRHNKFRPLIPTLQVFYYNGSFQGGLPGLHDTGRRDDVIAQASWELRNGGLGDWFRVKEARSRWNQANLQVVEVNARVAAEVVGAAKQVIAGERALRSAQESVRQSEEMWTRLAKAAFGFAGPARQYDPLEALTAIQQLNRNRLRYLDEVITYNRNQFRLYWAMGKPAMCALPDAVKVPVRTPVLPSGPTSENQPRAAVEKTAPSEPKP